MRKTKKTLAILAIVAMVFTMIPMQLFAASATTYDRIGGQTQYDTAALIAKAEFPSGTSTAVIAVGTVGNSYDALAAGPLAVKKNAPILLTEGTQLTAVTKTTLQSLGVKNVIIVGGTGVVKQGVEDSIKALGISTSRLAGFDAAETSVKVAQAIGSSSTIVLAGGRGQDALSVAPIAAAKGYPILYTDKASNLPDTVANYVSGLSGVSTSYVIGGVGVITDAEALQLPGTKVRYGGYDAYDTNLAVIQGLVSSINFGKVYVANGQTMVDALAGAPLAAATNSAIVLTDNVKIPAAQFVSSQLSASSEAIALGGTAAVSDSILHQISYTAPVENNPKITGVTSPDANTLVVSFDKAVVNSAAQPVTVSVKQGSTAVEIASQSFTADQQTLTIKTKAPLATSTAYAISVTPVNRDAITYTFTTPASYVVDPTKITATVSADAKTVTVNFDNAVADTTKAAFTVTKGTDTVAQTSVFSTDKKVATLTFADALAAGDYTVSVSGAADTALTATFNVVAPVPTAITVAKGTDKTVTVTFDAAVADTSKAVFTVKKGDTVIAQTAAFDADKKVATLTFDTAPAVGDYTVSVSGVAEVDLTATYTVFSIGVQSVSVIDVNKIKVTFSAPVDPTVVTAALKIGAAAYYTTTEFADDNLSLTLTAPSKISAGTYDVVVSGIAAADVVTPITVADETPVAIAVTTTQVTSGAAAAPVDFTVNNQYGTAMTAYGNDVLSGVSAYDVTANVIVPVVATANSATKSEVGLNLSSTSIKVGDTVRVIITYKGLAATANATVVAPTVLSNITLGAVAPKTGTTRITVGDTGLELPYTLTDQYGNIKTLTAGDFGVSGSGADVTFASSNTSIINPSTITVDSNGKLTFNVGSTAGTATITAVINASGAVASTNVVVNKAAALKTVTIAPVTTLVAAGDDTITLKLTGVDQYGAASTVTSGNVNVTTSGTGLGAVTVGTNVLNVTPAATLTAAGTATVNLVDPSTGTVLATFTITVQPNATPNAITGVSIPSTLEVGATETIAAKNIKVKDQYGRDYTIALGDVDIAYANTSATTHAVTLSGATLTAGTTAGTEAIKFTLANGASYTVNFNVVASSSITSYSVTGTTALYGNSNDAAGSATHAQTLTLQGKLADGTLVVLNGNKIAAVTSSNGAIATATTGVDANTVKVTGVDKGTATVSLWDANGNKLADVSIAVDNTAPVITAVAFDKDTETSVAKTATVDLSDNLSVTDQYGVDVTTDTGFWASSDNTIATVNNGVVTGVAAGSVTITYVTSNGLVKTTTLNVTE